MPPQAPSFGSQEYWNKRFTSDSSAFEWLEAPAALDSHITAALKGISDPEPQVLHIGCGTSLLSYHLCTHVKRPGQIHNVDYSDVAIEVGKGREVDMLDPRCEPLVGKPKDSIVRDEAGSNADKISQDLSEKEEADMPQSVPIGPSDLSHMRWSPVDLLNHTSLLKSCRPSTYSLIVDKSTSDSIACSDDLWVPLPYYFSTSPIPTSSMDLTKSPEPIHPLHIMAVHLAVLTKPKGRWISLSYSTDRYPFIDLTPPNSVPTNSTSLRSNTLIPSMTTETSPLVVNEATAEKEDPEEESIVGADFDDIPQKIIENGLPDPGALWKMVGKYDIEAPLLSPQPSSGSSVTHRPKVMHWIYILERTDVKVFVRR